MLSGAMGGIAHKSQRIFSDGALVELHVWQSPSMLRLTCATHFP